MKNNNSIWSALVVLAIATLSVPASAQMNNGVMSPPANTRPPQLENVGIEQHLDAQVPPDLAFRDETGKTVKLGDYFGRKPLILNLVYYNCTMLCGEALAGLSSAMRLVKFDVGNEFDVVTVSFDPRETPEMAAAKKKDYVGRYGRANAAGGWHFLTGQPESINALTKAVGFQYHVRRQKQPVRARHGHHGAHACKVAFRAKYFYGVDFPAERFAHGTGRSFFAGENRKRCRCRAALYCYHYNPRDR